MKIVNTTASAAKLCATLFLVLICQHASAQADSGFSGWKWHGLTTPCEGNCAVHVYGGAFADTDMASAFGLGQDILPDPSEFIAPWNYELQPSYLIAAAFSKRLLSFGSSFDIEAEAGIAQRFGIMHETEFWSALYFRWKAFPWNDYLYTTAAISTGLNYATGIPELERTRDDKKGTGAKLLHFLSPEITFALPEHKELELVFRYHHRSGGGNIFGEIDLFNGVSGGAHHVTAGFRYRF